MEILLRDIGVNENLTKGPRRQKRYNKVKDNIPKVEHYNYNADLLFLPQAKYGYKYLLVMVDLANDEFDIEPLKEKNANAVLNATKKIFKRGILKMPYASIRTDSGTEFKSVYHKFMHDNNILHKISLPDRHKQTANVERLNRELSRIIMGYLNSKDEKNNKVNTNWIELVPVIRDKLNKIRKKPLPKGDTWKTMDYPTFNPTKQVVSKTKKGNVKVETKMIEPSYKVGDMVHHVLDRPQDAQGKKQIGGFRVGDHRYSTEKKKITKVLLYPGTAVQYRYMLEGIKQASYSKHELKK